MRYNIIITLCSVLLSLFTIISIRSCNNIENEKEILEQNLKASKDTLKVLKDKNGELYYQKESYISKAKDLESLNKQMYETIKNLKEEINSGLTTIVKVTDTVVLHDSVLINNSGNYVQSFNDGVLEEYIYQRVETEPLVLFTDSVKYSVNIPVEAYFTDDYKIILKSKNQNVSFSNVDAFISPNVIGKDKKKRWGIGFNAGFGGLLSTEMKISLGAYIGIGISYNLITW